MIDFGEWVVPHQEGEKLLSVIVTAYRLKDGVFKSINSKNPGANQ
jgi:hypothetical protein